MVASRVSTLWSPSVVAAPVGSGSPENKAQGPKVKPATQLAGGAAAVARQRLWSLRRGLGVAKTTLFGPGPQSFIHAALPGRAKFVVRGHVYDKARMEIAARALSPIPQAKDWVKFSDLISVEFVDKDTLVIKAKGRPENGEQHESIRKTLLGIHRTKQWSHFLEHMLSSTPESERDNSFDYFAALLGAQMVKDSGFEIKVTGIKNLDPEKAYLYAATHGTMLQFFIYFLVMRVLGQSLGFVAKDDFKKFPLDFMVGNVMAKLKRFLFLNRKDPAVARAQLSDFAQWLSENPKASTMMFPEGTRHKAQRDAQGRRLPGDPLKMRGGLASGTFELAAQSGRPVVPVVDNMAQIINESGGSVAVAEGAKIWIVIGEPLDPEHVRDGDKVNSLRRRTLDFFREVYSSWGIPMISDDEASERREKYKLEQALKLLGKAKGPIGDKSTSVDHTRVLKSLKTLQAIATGPQDAAKYPKAANKERRVLNHFLDYFYEAVKLKEQGREKDLRRWLKRNKIDQAWFNSLYQWMDQSGELSAMKKRFAEVTNNRVADIFDTLL